MQTSGLSETRIAENLTSCQGSDITRLNLPYDGKDKAQRAAV